MPVIRIVQKGSEGYNGPISGVMFENGVSTEPLSMAECERIGCFMKVVDEETGEPISLTKRMVDTKRNSIDPKNTKKLQQYDPKVHEKPKNLAKTEKADFDFSYTRESLESIADSKGISGLREVSREYNITGVSIAGIIDAMMAKKEAATQSEG